MLNDHFKAIIQAEPLLTGCALRQQSSHMENTWVLSWRNHWWLTAISQSARRFKPERPTVRNQRKIIFEKKIKNERNPFRGAEKGRSLWPGAARGTRINTLLETEPCERHMFEQTGGLHPHGTNAEVWRSRSMTEHKKKVIYPLLPSFRKSGEIQTQKM